MHKIKGYYLIPPAHRINLLFVSPALHVMQKTIRNVDENVFEKAKRVADEKGIRMGDAVNEALLNWITDEVKPEKSIMDFEPLESGKDGNLSEEYEDDIYG
ncbi:MAG: hypothetical protein ABEJ02_01760 [Candidatus Paceibacteria bacterium]